MTNNNFYQTDFGLVRLSDSFVAEARQRWPGFATRRTVDLGGDGPDFAQKEDAWVGRVHSAIAQRSRTAYESGRPQPHFATLADAGF